jgi:redox-sensitive bicupin YhaK (pirin superfamily)
VETLTPIFYLHFILQPGAKVAQPVQEKYNTFANVINLHGSFGKDVNQNEAKGNQMAIFANDGNKIIIGVPNNINSTQDFLLVGGIPLNESLARYGPLVMNTKQELFQAIEDYCNGRLGGLNF